MKLLVVRRGSCSYDDVDRIRAIRDFGKVLQNDVFAVTLQTRYTISRWLEIFYETVYIEVPWNLNEVRPYIGFLRRLMLLFNCTILFWSRESKKYFQYQLSFTSSLLERVPLKTIVEV